MRIGIASHCRSLDNVGWRCRVRIVGASGDLRQVIAGDSKIVVEVELNSLDELAWLMAMAKSAKRSNPPVGVYRPRLSSAAQARIQELVDAGHKARQIGDLLETEMNVPRNQAVKYAYGWRSRHA